VVPTPRAGGGDHDEQTYEGVRCGRTGFDVGVRTHLDGLGGSGATRRETRDKAFFVVDAAGNDVIRIHGSSTTVATVLSKKGQSVPTSLAIGPDGAL
jgi:hypothetical protein